ncbi:MAG TPA: hypothetical protein VFS03_12255, partial [Microvirga sp.]|nr:hypothetical protein [Microvirga sp.]
VKIDTANTDAKATLFANRLAREIRGLTPDELEHMLAILDGAQERERMAACAIPGDAQAPVAPR